MYYRAVYLPSLLSLLSLAACSSNATTSIEPEANPGNQADAGTDAGGSVDLDASIQPLPVTRVAVVSDMNGSYGATTYRSSVDKAVAQILIFSPDLVIATGDLVAGQRSGLDYAVMWAGLHGAVSDKLAASGLPLC